MAPTSGEGGIRTPDAGITDITVFETAAFNRSATSPRESIPPLPTPSNRRNLRILNYQTSLAKSPIHYDTRNPITEVQSYLWYSFSDSTVWSES